MNTAITIDIDWAPDEVLEYTLDIIVSAGIPCTLFATHKTSVLEGLDAEQFEICVHPNFNPLLNGNSGTPKEIIEPLREAFPKSRGIRSHSSLVSNVLVSLWGEYGYEYECNICLPYSRNLELLPLWNGMLRIPFNWEDYLHFSYGRSFDSTGLDMTKGLNILNFHPVHVYLNTESLKRYNEARSYYQNPHELVRHRNEGAGTATLLRAVLNGVGNFVKLENLMVERAHKQDPAAHVCRSR